MGKMIDFIQYLIMYGRKGELSNDQGFGSVLLNPVAA